MDKIKMVLMVSVLLSALMVSMVIGAAVVNYYFPQQAVVNSISATFRLDGAPWTDSALIDWGNVDPSGVYTKAFSVNNTGTVDVTVSMHVDGLPAGWTEVWSVNGTQLAPGVIVTGDLVLSVSPTATPGLTALPTIRMEIDST